METRLLKIYLDDHCAALAAGAELARRCAGSNEKESFGPELARIADGFQRGASELKRLAARLGFKGSLLKNAGALMGERAGRLKLNGRWIGYSPLSRLEEIETLVAAACYERLTWLDLSTIVEQEEVPAGLADAAEERGHALEALALRAARILSQT